MGLTSSKSQPSSSSSAFAGSSQSRPAESTAFSRNPDLYVTLDAVQQALRKEGLESSQLIVAIDYTKSNEWTGKYSCGGRSLHYLSAESLNPYQTAMRIIAKTLSSFDDDGLIPCYGFGDAQTGDKRVFSFKSGPGGVDMPCHGLEDVEDTYRTVTPHVKLSGPTSFAPAIHQAMKLVQESGGQYHILLLVADGQVTRSADMPRGQFSPQEDATIKAIVEASAYPLSIVMIGVGDGPWDMMKEFDDALPQRRFDNFQFVNALEVIMSFNARDHERMEAAFALRALMEIPQQFKAPGRPPAPPPSPPPNKGKAYDDERTSAASGSAWPSARTSFTSTTYGDATGGFDRNSAGGPSVARPSGTGSATGGRESFDRTSAGSFVQTPGASEALFMCPITQELMSDPVLAADGYTYEKTAVERWLATHHTSPMTNAPLPHKNLIPNHALRSSIMEYRQAMGLPV